MPSCTADPGDRGRQLARLDSLTTTGRVRVGAASEPPQVVGTAAQMRHGFRRGQGASGLG